MENTSLQQAQLLKPAQASENALARMRSQSTKGPPWMKLGGSVGHRPVDILDWQHVPIECLLPEKDASSP